MSGRQLLAAFGLLLAAEGILAQDAPLGVVGPPSLLLSFSNPGARSMGFGGAFVALADDATAAFANPAGLVQLTRPEISLERRNWYYSTTFTERARLGGEPTGLGVDVVAGLRSGASSDDLTGVSFLSFVYPKGRWSIALYRHQLADFRSLFRTQGLFSADDLRFVDRQIRTDLKIVGYGLASAYRASDVLSLGLSLVYFDGTLAIVGEPYLPDEDEALGRFAPTSYLPERMVAKTSLTIDDGNWGVTAGFLAVPSPRLRLGGFYRKGPAFEMRIEAVSGPSGGFFGLPPSGTTLDRYTSPSALPDVYGLGWSFRTRDERLTIAFEWDRIEYSTIVNRLSEELDPDDFILEDGDEFHLGAEYVFLRTTPPVAVRLGAWLDPDHRPTAKPDLDPLARALLPAGDDEIHYALGLGLAFENFQVDVGADFSYRVDALSLSGIYSF